MTEKQVDVLRQIRRVAWEATDSDCLGWLAEFGDEQDEGHGVFSRIHGVCSHAEDFGDAYALVIEIVCEEFGEVCPPRRQLCIGECPTHWAKLPAAGEKSSRPRKAEGEFVLPGAACSFEPQTTNRQIVKATLGPDCSDAGSPVRVYLHLDGEPALDRWHLSAGPGEAFETAIGRLFDVTGADEWGEVVGRFVRTRVDGIWIRLGHITRELWIDNRGRKVDLGRGEDS